MSPLYKRLRENTKVLWIQSGGNRLPAKKSLRTNLNFQRYTLCPLNSLSTRLWSRSISRDDAVEMIVDLEEGHLPGQIKPVTSEVKRAISRYTASKREMALVGTHPRIPQMSSQNGLLRSLLSQIPKIWQPPPWPATTRSTSGASIAIMVRVHGDFTGRMTMRNGKLSKARSLLLVFPILSPMQ